MSYMIREKSKASHDSSIDHGVLAYACMRRAPRFATRFRALAVSLDVLCCMLYVCLFVRLDARRACVAEQPHSRYPLPLPAFVLSRARSVVHVSHPSPVPSTIGMAANFDEGKHLPLGHDDKEEGEEGRRAQTMVDMGGEERQDKGKYDDKWRARDAAPGMKDAPLLHDMAKRFPEHAACINPTISKVAKEKRILAARVVFLAPRCA